MKARLKSRYLRVDGASFPAGMVFDVQRVYLTNRETQVCLALSNTPPPWQIPCVDEEDVELLLAAQ